MFTPNFQCKKSGPQPELDSEPLSLSVDWDWCSYTAALWAYLNLFLSKPVSGDVAHRDLHCIIGSWEMIIALVHLPSRLTTRWVAYLFPELLKKLKKYGPQCLIMAVIQVREISKTHPSCWILCKWLCALVTDCWTVTCHSRGHCQGQCRSLAVDFTGP